MFDVFNILNSHFIIKLKRSMLPLTLFILDMPINLCLLQFSFAMLKIRILEYTKENKHKHLLNHITGASTTERLIKAYFLLNVSDMSTLFLLWECQRKSL